MIGIVLPTLTQGQTDHWANLNAQGQAPPTRTDEDKEVEVRATAPSGSRPAAGDQGDEDPGDLARRQRDRIVPSRLCVERLDPVTREPGRDFTYRVFPGGTHGLLFTANGLNDEQAQSSRFVEGYHGNPRLGFGARGSPASARSWNGSSAHAASRARSASGRGCVGLDVQPDAAAPERGAHQDSDAESVPARGHDHEVAHAELAGLASHVGGVLRGRSRLGSGMSSNSPAPSRRLPSARPPESRRG